MIDWIKKYWLWVAMAVLFIFFLPKLMKKPRARPHRRAVVSRAKRIRRARRVRKQPVFNRKVSRSKPSGSKSFHRTIHGKVFRSPKSWGAEMHRLQKRR
jgi:hypothetical protein